MLWLDLRALGSRNNERRRQAVLRLKRARNQRAVAPLIEMLKDDRTNLRITVADILGILGDQRALQPLIALLQDRVYDVRAQAATALDAIGAKDCVEPLIRAFSVESEPSTWSAIATVLAGTGDRRAIACLVAAVDRVPVDVIGKALKTVAADWFRGDEAKALVPYLSHWVIRHNDVAAREFFAEILGIIADEQGVHALLIAKHDRQPALRSKAAEALINIERNVGSSIVAGAVPALISSLHDISTRQAAWLALSSLKAEWRESTYAQEIAKVLVKSLQEKSVRGRQLTSQILREMIGSNNHTKLSTYDFDLQVSAITNFLKCGSAKPPLSDCVSLLRRPMARRGAWEQLVTAKGEWIGSPVLVQQIVTGIVQGLADECDGRMASQLAIREMIRDGVTQPLVPGLVQLCN